MHATLRWSIPERPGAVYGPRSEPVPTRAHPVAEGASVAVQELGIDPEVLDIPGCTRRDTHGLTLHIMAQFPSLPRRSAAVREMKNRF